MPFHHFTETDNEPHTLGSTEARQGETERHCNGFSINLSDGERIDISLSNPRDPNDEYIVIHSTRDYSTIRCNTAEWYTLISVLKGIDSGGVYHGIRRWYV